ncbi:hypothetical protein L4D06_16840 [Enterovibrio makurazakiensis]|uniref:hypothetical protein n=1 Tax=Enterovibrio makurazakiensis TaxID=2910232 RepID=UPI003D1D1D1C
MPHDVSRLEGIVSQIEGIVGAPLITRSTGISFVQDGQPLAAFLEEMDDRTKDMLFWIK